MSPEKPVVPAKPARATKSTPKSATPTDEPPAKPRISRRLAIGGGAVAVAVVGVATTMLLASGGSSIDTTGKGSYLVQGLESAPTVAWTYFSLPPGSKDYIKATSSSQGLPPDRVAVWDTLDYTGYAAAEGSGWYVGYDADFDAGTAAGERYVVDYDAWDVGYQAFIAEHPLLQVGAEGFYSLLSGDMRPLKEDYYPKDEFSQFPIMDQPQGWLDAFNAASSREDVEAIRVVAPEDPEFVSSITLVDLTTGEALWTVPLSDLTPAANFRTQLSVKGIDGTSYLAVYTITLSADSSSAERSIATIDLNSGAVVGTTPTGRGTVIASADEAVIVRVSGEDASGDETVSRFNPADLAAGPVWSVDLEQADAVASVGDYLTVTRADGGRSYVIDSADGTPAPWGGDLGVPGVEYVVTDGMLVRISRSAISVADGETTYSYSWDGRGDPPTEADPVGGASSFIQAFGLDGQPTWAEPLRADYVFADSAVLLLGDAAESTVTNLRRIDPATGEPMWKDPYTGTIAKVLDSFSGTILCLPSGDDVTELIVLDAASGAEQTRIPITPPVSYFAGVGKIFLIGTDSVTAFPLTDAELLWTFPFDPDSGESVTRIGDHLVVVNSTEHTIEGLG